MYKLIVLLKSLYLKVVTIFIILLSILYHMLIIRNKHSKHSKFHFASASLSHKKTISLNKIVYGIK